MVFYTVANSIMGTDASGLRFNLGLDNFFPPAQSIMYYNYIAIFIIVLWSAFASQSNESRYTVTTPFIAALMVFLGWLRAPNPESYWGAIVMCILLGAFMYINDMNHEKYGLPGPGDKWIATAILVICFSASAGFVSSSQFNFFPDQNMGSTANVFCGSQYQCDSSGNIMLDASVSQVAGSGGINQDVVSAAVTLTSLALSIIKTLIIIVGAVLLFVPVMTAAYPAIAASPQAMALLAIIQVVIWAIYVMGIYRTFKPGVGGGEI